MFVSTIQNLLGLLFYPTLTHPSTCIVHAEYHYCVTVYRSDVQPEKQSDHNFDTYGFQFFPGNHLRSSNSNYTDLKNKAEHNDVSASLTSKTYLMGFIFFPQIIMRI